MSKRKSSKNYSKNAGQKPDWQPIRATRMWRVDQVFLSHSGTRIKVVMSLVNDRSGLRNETIIAPTSDPKEAVRLAARFLGGKGDVSRQFGLRIRWARQQAQSEQDGLVRDHELEGIFLEGLEESIEAIRDQMR